MRRFSNDNIDLESRVYVLWNDFPGVLGSLCFLHSRWPCDHLEPPWEAMSSLTVLWLTCQGGEWICNLDIRQGFIKVYDLYTYHLASLFCIQKSFKRMWMTVTKPKMLMSVYGNPGSMFLLPYWKSNDIIFRDTNVLCVSEERWISVSHF